MGKSSAYSCSALISAGGKSARVTVEIANSARAKNFRARIAGRDEIKITKPAWASRRAALEFLESVSEWAIKALENAACKIPLRQYLEKNPFVFVDGQKWKVWIEHSRTDAFFVEAPAAREVVFSAPFPGCGNGENDPLCGAFRNFAAAKISEMAARTADSAGIGHSSISVRDQSGIWASRSSGGGLSFNWRMLFLTPELQNYIVCHELAHARFMDHSVSFWIWLNSLCPRAKRLDRELSKISPKLFGIILK